MKQLEKLQQEITKIVAKMWQTHKLELQIVFYVSHTHRCTQEMCKLSERVSNMIFADKTLYVF